MKKLLIGAALSALMCSGASAVTLGVTAVTGSDLNDYRVVNGGPLDMNDGRDGLGAFGTGAWNDIKVSWNISYDNGLSLWCYEYTIEGAGDDGGQAGDTAMSHITLQISDADVRLSDLEVDGEETMFTMPETGDDNSTGSFAERGTWVKIEEDGIFPSGTFSVSFKSDRMPVWGDFVLKGGRGNEAANLALINGVTEGDKSLFVPRPDTKTGGEIPEPSRALFGLLGVMGSVFIRRRPRSKK